MPCRYEHLVYGLEGLKKTGLSSFMSHSIGDDIGIYLIIPKLAYIFDLSLDTVIGIFFYSILVGSFVFGFSAFCFLYETLVSRIIAGIGLFLLALLSLRIGDVYIIYSSSVVALIPWFMYCIRYTTTHMYLIFYCFFAGFMMSTMHYIRAYSTLPVIVFMIIVIVCTPALLRRKNAVYAGVFSIGLLLPILYVNQMYNQHKLYSQEQFKGCEVADKYHPFWHPVYVGFGFLKFLNEDNIEFADSCGFNKARTIQPDTLHYGADYEAILKYEVFNLIKTRPKFVLFTIFAKIGILLFYFLLCANVGLIAALLYPQSIALLLGFCAALLASSLFPILALPVTSYSLGFISLATLFGITSINNALEQIVKRKIKTSKVVFN